jgi:hypothetical protein
MSGRAGTTGVIAPEYRGDRGVRAARSYTRRMAFQRGTDGSEPARSQPVARMAGARADHLLGRSGQMATGTLACPRCDAPVALGAGPASPADPLGCPFCDHAATVREFLSLASPARPARVAVRVIHY